MMSTPTIINNLPKGNVKAPLGAVMKINTGELLTKKDFDNNTDFILEFTLDNLDQNNNPIYVRNGITEDEAVIGRKAGVILVEYNMPNMPLRDEEMNFYYPCRAPFSIDTIFTKYPLLAQQIKCYFKYWDQANKNFEESSDTLTAQYASNNTASYIYTMKNDSPLVWYIDIKTSTPAEDLTVLGENMTTAMWGSGSRIISPGRYLLYSSDGLYLCRFKLNTLTESLSNTSLEFLPNQIKLLGQVSYKDPYTNDIYPKTSTISLFPEADEFSTRFSLTGDDLVIENNVFFEGSVNLSKPLEVNFKTQIAENLSSTFYTADQTRINYKIIQYNTNFYILEVLQNVTETKGPYGFSIPKSYFDNKQYITFLGFTTAYYDGNYLTSSSYPTGIKSYLSDTELELHYSPQGIGDIVLFYAGDIFMFMAF